MACGKAGAGEAEDCDVEVADDREDKGVVEADGAIGDFALGERDDGSADDAGDHEAGPTTSEGAEVGEAEGED